MKGLRNCDVCGCSVPSGSWDMHIAGIKHRRSALGPQCVTIFEDLPSAAAQPRYATRDPALAALRQQQHQQQQQQQQQWPTSGASTSRGGAQQWGAASNATTPTDVVDTRALQQRMQRELPHFCGMSGMLRRALAIFQPGDLSAASLRMAQALSTYRDAVRSGRRPLALRMGPLELACASQMLPMQRNSWLEHVRVEVPFHTDSPEGAAITAALAVLVGSLQHHVPLRCIEIRLGNRERLYQEVLQQRGLAAVMSSQLQGYWARVLMALARLATAHSGLRSIVLATPAGLLGEVPMQTLASALADPAPRMDRRKAVLLGTHPRVGAVSNLRRLPYQLLEVILDEAVPRTTPVLDWQLLQWQPGVIILDSSSSDASSSSSEDEGSSGDDDDDSSSSSDDAAHAQVPVASDVLAVAKFLM